MANITKYLEKKLLEQSVGKTDFGSTFNAYAALFTSTPTVDYANTNTGRDGNEVSASGTNYARKQITWNSATANTDSTNSSFISNFTELKWPGATGTISGNWGTITTIGIFDSDLISNSPAGNLLWFGPLSASVTLTNGDTFTINQNQLKLTLG